VILSHGFQIDSVHLYMMEAWMGFVPNLVVAEWWIRNRIRRKPVADTDAKSMASV